MPRGDLHVARVHTSGLQLRHRCAAQPIGTHRAHHAGPTAQPRNVAGEIGRRASEHGATGKNIPENLSDADDLAAIDHAMVIPRAVSPRADIPGKTPVIHPPARPASPVSNQPCTFVMSIVSFLHRFGSALNHYVHLRASSDERCLLAGS